MVTARLQEGRRARATLLAGILLLLGSARAETVSQVMTVRAAITPGCWFGTAQAPLLSLGTIDFGVVHRLDKEVKTRSSVGAGSVVMTCTPGTTFRVDINDGGNAGALWWYAGRQVKNAASGKALRYELYRDSAYSQRWGQSSEGAQFIATGGLVVLPIYAKLLSTQTAPEPGVYTDDLIVTVYY